MKNSHGCKDSSLDNVTGLPTHPNSMRHIALIALVIASNLHADPIPENLRHNGWCISNLKPVECLRILEGRVISVHLEDKAAYGEAPVVVAGTGVVDVAACLEELKKQKFDGHISIEHENDWKNSVPQVRANIDFVKSHGK
jgi:hypothetical protein